MDFISKMEAFNAERSTPQGRALEAKNVAFDCNVLLLGVLGLALHFPPLIYVAAAGHVIAGFRISPSKLFWLLTELPTIAILTGLLGAGIYAVQVYYIGYAPAAVVESLRANAIELTATAAVMGGLLSTLFCHPGIVYQYVDEMNARGT